MCFFFHFGFNFLRIHYILFIFLVDYSKLKVFALFAKRPLRTAATSQTPAALLCTPFNPQALDLAYFPQYIEHIFFSKYK